MISKPSAASKTEDDTYDKLRRIPYDELLLRLNPFEVGIEHRVHYNLVMNEANKNTRQFEKFANFFHIKIKADYHQLYDVHSELSADSFANTGWTPDAYVEAVTERMTDERKERKDKYALARNKTILCILIGGNIGCWLVYLLLGLINPIPLAGMIVTFGIGIPLLLRKILK